MSTDLRFTTPVVAYDLPLRPDLLIRVVLPVDFSDADAERLCEIIRSLAMPPPDPGGTP